MTLPERTKIRRAGRLDTRRRKLGSDRCAVCGLEDLRTLQLSKVVLCAHCRLTLQGILPLERHHLLGRNLSSFAILLPANLHAVLNFMGIDHPPECNSDRELKMLYVFRDWLEVLSEITAAEIERLGSDHGDA
jgi:hypothetical protein